MFVLFFDLERISLAKDFEVFDGVRRGQLKMDIHLARGEPVINIGPKRDSEQRFQILDLKALVVFDLHALGAVCGDRKYSGAEGCGMASLIRAALTLLQK